MFLIYRLYYIYIYKFSTFITKNKSNNGIKGNVARLRKLI